MQLDSFLGKLGVIFCGVCEQTAVCVLGEGGLFEQGVPLGPPGAGPLSQIVQAAQLRPTAGKYCGRGARVNR